MLQMGGLMLYNDYRPKTLEEVFGHKEIKESLKSLFKEKAFPHAFLFSGPSGTGKTTFARIMANMLNAGSDIIEINIANTNGVDFIRELNEVARRSPLLGNNKVFILDEVQQLTKEGQNCLLKLLEDSPKYSYFILCTTDQQKLLPTIKNRCLSYTLKALSNKDIESILVYVTTLEKLVISEDVLNLLVYKSSGCPRKALVMLNQVKDIKDFDKICTLLADELEQEQDIIELCRLIIKRPRTDWKNVVKTYENINIESEQMRIVIAGYLAACLKKADSPSIYAEKLELFLSPLTFGSQKSELLLLIYKAWVL